MGSQPSIFTTGSSWVKFNNVEYPMLTALTYTRNLDKIEATTVSTAAGFKAYLPLRSEATLDMTIYNDSGSNDLPQGTEYSLTGSFGGKRYQGLATIYTKTTDGAIDGLIGTKYQATFNGTVTEITGS